MVENTASFKLLQDGYEGVALTKMFPAKGFYPSTSSGGGAWYAAKLLDEQQRVGKESRETALQVRSYSRLKKERVRMAKLKRLYEQGQMDENEMPIEETQSQVDERETHLDGFYLLRTHGVSDPGDLSAIDISARPLETANDEDMELFENVIYINAAETLLPFETFNHFPSLRELETPLCAIRSIRVNMNDFDCLELLDLSYNNLSPEDVASLSILPKLKALYLTGNELTYLPESLCSNVKFKSDENSAASAVEVEAFQNLEVLHLDDNRFQDANTIAILAGLRHLKYLSLDNNSISAVPHIKIKKGKPIERVHVNAVEFNVNDNDDELDDDTISGKSQNLLEGIDDITAANEGSLSDAKLTNSLTGVDLTANSSGQNGNKVEGSIGRTIPEESESNEEGTVVPVNSLINSTGAEKSEGESQEQILTAFEELRIFSIANNQIASEDGVLPVVGWPMLQQVNIAGNPLVAKHNGEPPLLNRYLTNRLGITLKRFDLPQKSKVPHDPIIDNPTSKPPTHRRIPEVVPPKKRQPIDFMAIEYPGVFDPLPSKENTLEMIETRRRNLHQQFIPEVNHEAVPPSLRAMSANQNAPLPPISSTNQNGEESLRPQSGPDNMQHMRFAPSEMERLATEDVLIPKGGYQRPKMAPIVDEEGEGGEATEEDQENFFMTQIDDEYAEGGSNRSQQGQNGERVTGSKQTGGSKSSSKKGAYRLLYQTNEDEEKFSLNLPKDVQSNVKALKYALKHPVSFSDAPASHERIMHLYQPDKYKRPSKPKKVQQSKADLFYDTLSDLKHRVAYVETNLEKALVETTNDSRRAKEVNTLVKEIQQNYKNSSGSKAVKL